MKLRICLLLVLLVLRLIPGYIEASKYTNMVKVSVFGQVDKVAQNSSKCITYLDHFYFESDGYCKFSRGDEIKVIGNVNKRLIDILFGDLWLSSAVIDTKYKSYIANNKVIETKSFFNNIRENLATKIFQFLPNKEAGLVAGIVLGDKKGIGRDFNQEMINSGTIHIVVASGYNILLIGGTLLSLLFWILNRRSATLVALLGMMFYAQLSGGEPPAIRAVIMASMVYFGAVIGRKQSSWWALILAGWVMMMFDVSIIKSVSFQLSMMASVGLMMVEPWIKRYFDTLNSKMIQMFIDVGLLTSFSTLLTTAPIIWWHFGRFNPVGMISNIFVLPVVPLIMILGALMIPFSHLMVFPVYALAHLAVIVIEFFGR